MVVWMDAVDEALKDINKESSSAQDYERMKDKFMVRNDKDGLISRLFHFLFLL